VLDGPQNSSGYFGEGKWLLKKEFFKKKEPQNFSNTRAL
jgi:hypothetical protein